MKSIEKFYDAPMGGYCGVLMREKMAKKLAKLLHKQNQEVKELLASDLSQLEVSNWSLAYPEGKQVTVKFYGESSDEEKLSRINLINKEKLIRYCKDGVFIADNMDHAEKVFMEWYVKTN